MRKRNPHLISMIFTLLIITSFSFAQKGNLNKAIDGALGKGNITYEEALLQKFYAGFDKSKLSLTFQKENQKPGKCATTLVKEFTENKSRLSQNAIEIIESYIGVEKRNKASASKYISPYGKFEISYSTTGEHAVSPTDTDASGIPDYVENIASYFDHSWKLLIDTLGYTAPPIGDRYYPVSFLDMEYYGFCSPENNPEGMTSIVMHNTYIGFGNNEDPEDPILGAAKVTAIHEFKHALQFINSLWREPGWMMEIDATWTEDIGYDYVNDYYNYLFSSQITSPARSFENGDGYEDCIWMHYLSEKYGVQINREIWERSRDTNENIYEVFDNILKQYNSTYEEALMEYFSWNILTGTNADNRLPSFEEAERYPSPSFCESFILSEKSDMIGCGMDNMAANFIEITSNSDLKFLKLTLSPENGKIGNNIFVFPKNEDPFILRAIADDTLTYISDIYLNDIEKIYFVPVAHSILGEEAEYSYTVEPYNFVELSHTPLKDTEDNSSVKINVTVESELNLTVSDSLFLYYNENDGEFSKVSLTHKGNNLFEFDLSGISMESKIDYYFSIYDSLNNQYFLPSEAPLELFSFFVGIDNIPPVVEFTSQFHEKSIYNFPLMLTGIVEDNIGINEAYIEYSIENGTSKKTDISIDKNGAAFVKIEVDTSELNLPAKISYRIVVNDKSAAVNSTILPSAGYYEIELAEARYYSSTPNLFIPFQAFPAKRDTIIIEEDITIKDIDIVFKANHERFSDLSVMILPPNGSRKELLYRPGLETKYSEAKNPDLLFDDEATISIKDDYSLFIKDTAKGYFLPSKLDLVSLEGISAKGKWIIYLYDNEEDYEGELTEWGLIIQGDVVNNIKDKKLAPMVYALEQNYPNPFNPETVINYQIPTAGKVSLKVYDVLGKEVASLVDEVKQSGTYKVKFKSSNLASGIYIYTIRSNDFVSSKKMMLLK